MRQEIRFALRALRKSPGFAVTAIVTLAVAIGANTAMFSVINAVLLRPLPYRAPDQLAMVWTENPSQNLREGRSAYVNVDLWRQQTRTFADLAVFDPVSATLTRSDGAEQIAVARISPNIFSLLGVQPVLGRGFTQDEADQRQRVAVIGQTFWRTHFGASPAAVGATIELDGQPSRVVGILPAGFQVGRLDADVWEPHTLFPDWESRRSVRGADTWFVIGRLRPNVTIDQAQTEMTAIARRLDDQLPLADRNRGIAIVPLDLYVVGAPSRLALWMLAGAVGCVLLIAAANVASLSLARSVGRTREMAVRVALGASTARIVRQLLAESVTLAVLSGLLGTALAVAGIRFIRAFGPADLPRLNEIGLDPRVLAWALGVSLLTGVLVGLAPAIAMVRRRSLQASGRSGGEEGGRAVAGGAAARRIRRALVVAECALAIVLLVSAGLLIRSWRAVERVDPGFRAERVLSLQLSLPRATASAQRTGLYDRLLERLAAVPGVESAGLISDLFIGGNREQVLTTEGDTGARSDRLRFRRDEVSDRFFTTMGAPLRRGRFFAPADGPDAARVAIVNDSMARRLWPGLDPIGRRLKLGAADSTSPWITVVGVVGDMRRQGLENEPIPQMFEPIAQMAPNVPRGGTLLVRTSLDNPLAMIGTLQAAVQQVDPQIALYRATTLERALGGFLTQRRFQTSLLIGFSGVALLLAVIGIYGLIQYSVATRTHEIGIRMAIGAQAGDIFRMTVREGLALSLAGLALGLAGSVWVGRAVSSLLFGVTGTDPLTFLAVSLLLIAVAAAACIVPARRAMKIEPIMALRRE